jgi:hypothetical protein
MTAHASKKANSKQHFKLESSKHHSIRNPIGRPSRHVFGTRQGRYTDSWDRVHQTLAISAFPGFPSGILLIATPNYRCEGSDGIAAKQNRAPSSRLTQQPEDCQAPLTLLKNERYYITNKKGNSFDLPLNTCSLSMLE